MKIHGRDEPLLRPRTTLEYMLPHGVPVRIEVSETVNASKRVLFAGNQLFRDTTPFHVRAAWPRW